MAKLSKDFFTDNEVLFMGYSRKQKGNFSKMIYKTFVNNGIKVYPMNPKADGSFDIKVYSSFRELPTVPKCAYVLLSRNNAKDVVKSLAENGVKRIMFQNSKVADSDILNECKKLGIEAVVACPNMILGSGLHKLHGFFAGV